MYVVIPLLRVWEMFSSWSHKIGQFEKIDKSLEMLSVVNPLRCKGKNTEVLWTILTTPSMSYLFLGLTEKAMVPHSSTLAWKIPWTEEPGRL